MLQRFFQKYTGALRNFKAVYVINNWLNADRLKHNRALYRKYGLHKSVFSTIGTRDFKHENSAQELPWLDRPDALAQLEQNAEYQSFTPLLQDKIKRYIDDGFLILEGFYTEQDTDTLNRDVDNLLKTGKATFNYTGRKIFNLHETNTTANERFFRNPELVHLLEFLLGRPVIPFQSLNFTLGSEQRVHSDLIHMTTEPQGYLIATWAALEPCTPENGPLVYYPGSHRLPFVSTSDYDSGNTAFTIGNDSNKRYEDKIASLIAENGLQPKQFLAQRGDVLVWHANLLHGGSPITSQDANTTRKSMVCHYFGADVICYHEMSQRPALMPKEKT